MLPLSPAACPLHQLKLTQQKGDKGYFPVPFTKTSDSGQRSRRASELCDPRVRGALSGWEAGMSLEGLHILGNTLVPFF